MTKLIAKKIASGLDRPLFATSPPGDTARLFIVEQRTGLIKILRLATGTIDATPFLHVTGLNIGGNEQGLLGLAFAPDFATSGLLYVNLTKQAVDAAGLPTGPTVVRRYKVSATNPDVADPGSAQDLITIPQPFSNHNGGWIGFSPKDQFLYIGVGDGGKENDPLKTAQNPKLLLGKMLRIDVNHDGFPGDPAKNYAIPTDNPFVSTVGFLPEIWALGLRNPWRCSFDRQTGDLYIGDVGQDEVEEIDFQPASSKGGENYGWSLKEGTHPFQPVPGPAPTLIDPIDEYFHSDGGVTVVGGYVYRGTKISGLAGTYFYADSTGMIVSFRFNGTTLSEKTDRSLELFPTVGPSAISSFGEDAQGELYLINLIPGEVYAIKAAP
jgi:glucose/arabinose dehydrogenase